jgi:hypothetical protein
MKKLALLLVGITLIFASCNRKELEEKYDLLDKKYAIEKTTNQKLSSDLSETNNELDQCLEQKEALLPCDCKYYIVVGSFLELRRAKIWQEYIENSVDLRGKCYSTLTVVNENKFNCVYIKSGNDLQMALSRLDEVRIDVTPNAWIHINK